MSAVRQSWVDHEDYFGPNRRRLSAVLRLRERRHDDHAGPSPSLNVALRKLKLHVFGAMPGRKACAFADRAMGTSMIAAEHDARSVQVALEDLASRILARPNVDWRTEIYRELDRIGIEMCAVH